MHALSVKQPFAERIARGEKTIEYRTWAPRALVGRDLLIVASRSPADGYAGEPQGVAICVVMIETISGDPGAYEWHLRNARRVAPLPMRGFAALWHVDETELRYVQGARVQSARDFQRAARRTLERASARGPYSFSIGDRTLRGERASTPEKARARARALAAEHGATITISRDGIAIGGES